MPDYAQILQSSFGDQPPVNLMGWCGADVNVIQSLGLDIEHYDKEAAFEMVAESFKAFGISGIGLDSPGPPIWTFDKKVNGGRHLPTWYQKTGDCVSMGAVQGGQRASAFQIALRMEEEIYHPWFPPYIYGISRVQIGNGRLGRRAGSMGSWAAKGMMKYGVLFSDDPNVPDYSGSLADSWGYRGPADEFISLAKDNPVKSAARLNSVDEVRQALLNYHPVTIASNRGFKMSPRAYKDHHVFIPSGSWAHQMVLLSWMDDPFPAAYRLNSWGEGAHGKPLNDEPPGGAWNLADDLEKEIRGGGVELYALSSFDGFPGAPNFSILSENLKCAG